MKTAAFTFCLLLLSSLSFADELPFKDGEILNFDIRYKYGMVMVKAGSAQYRINSVTYDNQPAYKTNVDFKTTSFFDKIFKVRDTLYSYTNNDADPMYSRRDIHEGNTMYREEIYFKTFSSNFTEVRNVKATDAGVKFDTILVADMQGFDLLNIFTHMRKWDFSSIPMGDTRNIAIFTGKKRANVIVRFKGQTILGKSETLKYKAYKVELDIMDAAFSESKNAIEVWISDDENHIPLKIKAKLKIGAIEIDLANYKGIKYPLDSEVKIPIRK